MFRNTTTPGSSTCVFGQRSAGNSVGSASLSESEDDSEEKNQEVIRYGLFAIKGRDFDKTIKQQLEVVQHMEQYLYE